MLQATQRLQNAVCFLALFAAPLSAQTVGGPIVKEGAYFTQVFQGEVAGRPRLRISALGEITVRGADTQTVAYRILLKVRASNEQEAAQYLQQAQAGASSSADTTTLGIAEVNCGRCGHARHSRSDGRFR